MRCILSSDATTHGIGPGHLMNLLVVEHEPLLVQVGPYKSIVVALSGVTIVHDY